MMNTPLASALLLFLLSGAANSQSILITPESAASNTPSDTASPPSNLVDEMNTTFWATNALVDSGQNYFSFSPTQPNPALTFSFSNPISISGFRYAGYSTAPGSEAKAFQIQYFDSNNELINSAISHTAQNPVGNTIGMVSHAEAQNVSSAVVTIAANHFGNGNGGEQVGLGDIAFLSPSPVGDFDNNGIVGATDIAAVLTASLFNSDNLEFDVNGDGTVDDSDVSFVEAGFTSAGGTTVMVSNESELFAALIASSSSPGIRITFDPALDAQSIILSAGEIDIETSQELFIDASALTNGLTIDANQGSRVMRVNPQASIALHGLTLTGGNSPNAGGGISASNCTLSLTQCIITNSRTKKGNNGEASSEGGGIYASHCTINITASTLSKNETGDGGDAGLEGNGGNSGDGGGIFTTNSIINIMTSTISQNKNGRGGDGERREQDSFNGRGGSGGGIYSRDSTITISASTIDQNQGGSSGGGRFWGGRGGDGGGIYSLHSIITINTSTLAQNIGGAESDGYGWGAGLGGGIWSYESSLSITASTITQNKILYVDDGDILGGGGIALFSGSLFLENSIVADNDAYPSPDIQNVDSCVISPEGNNLIGRTNYLTFSMSDPPLGITLIAATDLNLAPLGNYGGQTKTMPPLLGSPAINTGETGDSESTDQRGFARLIGTNPDIGAVEFQGETQENSIAFHLDSDSDGSPNGVEIAIGTNPYVADAADERNLRLTLAPDGTTQFSFGLIHSQQSHITLELTRSLDLVTFDKVIASNEAEDFSDPGENLLILNDDSPPVEGRAFYRLQATQK